MYNIIMIQPSFLLIQRDWDAKFSPTTRLMITTYFTNFAVTEEDNFNLLICVYIYVLTAAYIHSCMNMDKNVFFNYSLYFDLRFTT